MTTDTDEARRLRTALAAQLADADRLHSKQWRQAVEAAPRHVFVPHFYRQDASGQWQTITADDPGYLNDVYADRSLTTQLTAGVPTSSSSEPGLMLTMLEALDAADGDRVIEIATGTGYNAALLSERLGSDNVTTIEVDPHLTDLAKNRLHSCGYTPTVLAGDGRAGHPDGAPYDRLIATCGFTTIPTAWLRQVRPGGVIVCPLGWGTVRLVVGDDGTAEGRFLSMGSYFMAVRDADTTGAIPYPGTPDTTTDRPSSLDPAALFGHDGFRFLVSLAAPDSTLATETDASGTVTACQMWAADGSWARVENGTARQAGPRRLWDAVEEAHAVYEDRGQPGRERFGLTATPEAQHAWLDTPDGPRWHLLS